MARKQVKVAIGFILALVGAAIILFYWMLPSYKTTKGFEEPKITVTHIDEQPFARFPLKEGERYRPLEVMGGTTVRAECQVVSVAPKRRFILEAFGKREEASDCLFDVQIPDEVGRTENIVFEFYDGGGDILTDRMEVPIIVVAKGERLEFQALEDADGHPIEGYSVPDKVRVYGRIIGKLPPKKDLAVLFFVADPTVGTPVVAVDPSADPERPKPLLGKIVRYRAYGKDLDGYAVWTPEPIALVSSASESRVVRDILFGVFSRVDLDRILEQVARIETRDGAVVVTPLVTDISALRRLTVNGNMLSPPLHVVVGSRPVEVGPPK